MARRPVSAVDGGDAPKAASAELVGAAVAPGAVNSGRLCPTTSKVREASDCAPPPAGSMTGVRVSKGGLAALGNPAPAVADPAGGTGPPSNRCRRRSRSAYKSRCLLFSCSSPWFCSSIAPRRRSISSCNRVICRNISINPWDSSRLSTGALSASSWAASVRSCAGAATACVTMSRARADFPVALMSCLPLIDELHPAVQGPGFLIPARGGGPFLAVAHRPNLPGRCA